MLPKFGKSNISMREVIITSILYGFDQKNRFFEGWSWFSFDTLGLALGKNLKFYTNVGKGLKKVQRKKCLGGGTLCILNQFLRKPIFVNKVLKNSGLFTKNYIYMRRHNTEKLLCNDDHF